MRRVQPFTVIADLPQALSPLRSLACNLWWSWNHVARNLFIRISKDSFAKSNRSPVRVLNSLSIEDIQTLSKDKGFIAQIEEVVQTFQRYRESRHWWSSQTEDAKDLTIAYFSAEFGLHESLPIYSGGLGVLAGDHLKACSDLGIPLIGVGLLYYEGYFSQYLNAEGWQQESYLQISANRLPIHPAIGTDGKQVVVNVDVRGTNVAVKAWQVDVGLVRLYLLDTNIDENDAASRAITARLYGGDVHMRIPQEIVLGIGGLRVLEALGIQPDVCHMNEGHSAFLVLEQIRRLMKEQHFDFEQALLGVRGSNLFTTHTMVPAGHDIFSAELMERYFRNFVNDLDIDLEALLRLGRVNPDDRSEAFSMAVLAVRGSQGINAVSELHGTVSRKLWQNIWPDLPLDESPIQHITNGVHTATWTSRDVAELYDRYIGPNWRNATALPETWEPVQDIPDDELWRIICRGRSSLITFCREKLREQLLRRGAGRVEIESAADVLDPDALTIGFARRFASYKRAALILHDIDRLVRICSNTERPVQFIFSGKAHPADQPGKELIARIIHASHRPELRGKFIFLEDYDMSVARKLVQGVDVWLNNPRRPLEASGTSGMKASANAGLNMSVLDGWWCEAFNGENGWSIGQGEEYEDTNYQDLVESRSIYDLLEREIIPTFYDQGPTGVPRDWLGLVKNSIQTIAPRFSAARMVSEYAQRYYIPLGLNHRQTAQQSYRNVLSSHADIVKFKKYWQDVRILSVENHGTDQLELGKNLPIRVTAQLGRFSPQEVAAEVRLGSLDATHHLHQCSIIRLTETQFLRDPGVHVFEGSLHVRRAGSYGFSVRLIPVIAGVPQSHIPGLISWWN
ncbi:MAG: alpha-glucan family phosphorylase [Bdellovibrionota bacterium]